MCEANAILLKGDREEPVLEAVDTIESSEDSVRLVSIFGEEKVLKARIKSLSLMEHKIVLEAL